MFAFSWHTGWCQGKPALSAVSLMAQQFVHKVFRAQVEELGGHIHARLVHGRGRRTDVSGLTKKTLRTGCARISCGRPTMGNSVKRKLTPRSFSWCVKSQSVVPDEGGEKRRAGKRTFGTHCTSSSRHIHFSLRAAQVFVARNARSDTQ